MSRGTAIIGSVVLDLANPRLVGLLPLGISVSPDWRSAVLLDDEERIERWEVDSTVDEFMRASKEGNVTVLKHFLEAGMLVDVKDGEGATALFRAAQAGRSEAVKILLEKGARTDLRTDKNWTALTAAAYRGEVECVKQLAPLSRDSLDEALQIASLQGKTAVIDALLAAGADVFSRSRENKTSLMYASVNGHADAVRLLLQHGSNPLALDNNDRTAIDFASAAGHTSIVGLLNDPKPGPPASSNLAATSAHGPEGVESHLNTAADTIGREAIASVSIKPSNLLSPSAAPSPDLADKLLEGEMYPKTRLLLLGDDEVARLSDKQLRYAINEMIARRGGTFRASIQAEFAKFSWYVPRPEATATWIELREFTAIEKANFKLLRAERDRRRKRSSH